MELGQEFGESAALHLKAAPPAFFATGSEFQRIYNAGISFFAVPVSVFHPRYIFLGLPPGTSPNDDSVIKLKDRISTALNTRNSGGGSLVLKPDPHFNFTWVSDIPEQAQLLAHKVNECLNGAGDTRDRDLVKLWSGRPIEDALGLGLGPRIKIRMIKAFIWGGPLTSVTLADAVIESRGVQSMPKRRFRFRDPDRKIAIIKLPSLSKAFEKDQIEPTHALYCCVGYKEDHILREYYTARLNEKDARPWSLAGLRYNAMSGSDIPRLVQAIQNFYESIFSAAMAMVQSLPHKPCGQQQSYGKVFEEFQADYDKFCRARNPVAQLYSVADYAECLHTHHDPTDFETLIRTSGSNKPRIIASATDRPRP